MIWTLIHKVIVIVYGDKSPTDQEFERLIADLHNWAGTCSGLLVLAGEMAPNARQRQRLNDDALMRSQRVAVLTDAPVVLGSITAMRWLGKKEIQGFSSGDVQTALDYLEVPIPARAAVVAAAARLKTATLGVSIEDFRTAAIGLSAIALDEFIIRKTALALKQILQKQAR